MIPKAKDHRVTSQRKIILEELCKVCTHPTAAGVYKIAKKRMPGIGLATVYRTLDFLEQRGLILKLQSKDQKARYDGNVKKHFHLICKKCGKIEDIFDVDEIKIKSKKLKKSGFKAHFDFLEIHGLCKNCIY